MKTVANIIQAVYGTPSQAAAALSVKRNCVSNWKKFGHFPARLLLTIANDATAKGADVAISEIPIKASA